MDPYLTFLDCALEVDPCVTECECKEQWVAYRTCVGQSTELQCDSLE